MKYSFLIIFIFISSVVYPQNNDWYPFVDEKTELVGYKDINGDVMIEPQFKGFFMLGGRFSDVVAVEESFDDNYVSYYLSKDGRKFGYDSMYVFDMAFDCEREGFIRFQPEREDRVGLFNHRAEVVVPPDYNYLTKVNNGLLVGLRDARKEFWDPDHQDEGGCNHWSWVDGVEYLLDTANNILVENFQYDNNHDFHTMRIEDSPSIDSLRDSYLGANGKYYTFINNEKYFRKWFFNEFLQNLTIEGLIKNSYEQIAWQDKSHYGTTPNRKLITAHYKLIINRISEVLKNECEYSISLDDYMNSQFEECFADYYDNCGRLKYNQYPQFEVIINHYKEGKFRFQDHFDFFKIDGEFKLLSLTIREVNLK